MIVTKVKANNLCKPAGMGNDDTNSRRVANDVSEQMENNPGGSQQVETGPGDTLESISKGHLKGTGQKVTLGNLLFNQQKIVSDNFDTIQGAMKDKGKNPEDFKTFRGRELPQGIKLNLETSHTQNSITPANPMERSQPSGAPDKTDKTLFDDQTSIEKTMNNSDYDDYFAGQGSISNTQYALEFHNIGLSDQAKDGMKKFLDPSKWQMS